MALNTFGSGGFGDTNFGGNAFYEVKDIISAVLKNTGHQNPTTETNKRIQVLSYLNNVYQEVILARNWRWLRDMYDFNFNAPYSDGTVSVAEGSNIVTGVGTAFSANLLPRDIIFFGGTSTVYHVKSVESHTSLTLENKFSEETVTDVAYTTATSLYKIPKEVGTIESIMIDSRFQLFPMGVEDFRRMQGRDPSSVNVPKFFTIVRNNFSNDDVYIEVWPAPDKRYQVQFDYTYRISKLEDTDDCLPAIPDRFRAVLYYGALSEFFYTTLRDPVNGRVFQDKYNSFLVRMQNDIESTEQALSFQPQRNYRRMAGSPTRIAGRGTTTIEDFGREG
jgi:hypothetical protein